MKVKTMAITLYQRDNGSDDCITDEDIQDGINERLENIGLGPENLIDVKMSTQFFDTGMVAEDSRWAWSSDMCMIIWNILVIYKTEE